MSSLRTKVLNDQNRKITIGSDFSGVGAFNQSLKRLGVPFEEVFACDMDKFARQTFCLNNGTEKDVELSKSKEHCKMCDDLLKYAGLKVPKAGSDEYLKYIEYGEALRAKSNELAKQYSFYYAFDVYAREIPADPLDCYVPTPPCQAFSLSGKGLGKEDRRGILFFNSLEFIEKNRPRYFMFENVKGLLSNDRDKNQKIIPGQANYGKTFREWTNFLGGKSVNGKETIFPYEDAVPYHIYFKVLNAKEYEIPQNRERVFIIGIRDDADNNFHFPKTFPLKKRLKHVLEKNVDEKYFLSDQIVEYYLRNTKNNKENGNGFSFKPKTGDDIANAITTKSGSRMDDNYIVVDNDGVVVLGYLTGGMWDKTHEQSRQVYSEDGISPAIHTMGGGGQHIKIKDGTRVRKLTPLECFRLMDFNFGLSGINDFVWDCSDSQAYKQAGNSVPVNLFVKLVERLNFE